MMKIKLVESDELYLATEEALKFLNEQPIVIRQNQDRVDEVKECQMIVKVNNLDNLKISKAMPGYYNDLVEYELELVHGIKDFEMQYKRDDNGGWSYTYHELFSKYLDNLINELKTNKISRRAVLPVCGERSYGTDDPPCMQWMGFQITDDKLDVTSLFRSNDAVGAFTMNCFGVIELARYISEELDIPLGTYTHIANNFHVYKRDFKKLEKYIENFSKNNQYYTFDEYKKRYEDYAKEIVEKLRKRELFLAGAENSDKINEKYDDLLESNIVRKRFK